MPGNTGMAVLIPGNPGRPGMRHIAIVSFSQCTQYRPDTCCLPPAQRSALSAPSQLCAMHRQWTVNVQVDVWKRWLIPEGKLEITTADE